MKKAIRILLCVICCFLLIACTNQAEIENGSSNTNTTAQTVEREDTSRTTEKSTQSKEVQGTTSSSSASSVKSEQTTSKKQEQNSAQSTSQKSTAAKNTTAKSTTAKAKVTSATTTTKKVTTASSITCTVTIECKKVLANMDKLKAGHESYVPSDGMILNNYSVTLENGCTAYDILKKACDDNGVKINMSNGVYSTYIVGFNNIDEKDCGSGSGWLYFINGSSPSKSCAKYLVKNGDSIVFSYTVG